MPMPAAIYDPSPVCPSLRCVDVDDCVVVSMELVLKYRPLETSEDEVPLEVWFEKTCQSAH